MMDNAKPPKPLDPSILTDTSTPFRISLGIHEQRIQDLLEDLYQDLVSKAPVAEHLLFYRKALSYILSGIDEPESLQKTYHHYFHQFRTNHEIAASLPRLPVYPLLNESLAQKKIKLSDQSLASEMATRRAIQAFLREGKKPAETLTSKSFQSIAYIALYHDLKDVDDETLQTYYEKIESEIYHIEKGKKKNLCSENLRKDSFFEVLNEESLHKFKKLVTAHKVLQHRLRWQSRTVKPPQLTSNLIISFPKETANSTKTTYYRIISITPRDLSHVLELQPMQSLSPFKGELYEGKPKILEKSVSNTESLEWFTPLPDEKWVPILKSQVLNGMSIEEKLAICSTLLPHQIKEEVSKRLFLSSEYEYHHALIQYLTSNLIPQEAIKTYLLEAQPITAVDAFFDPILRAQEDTSDASETDDHIEELLYWAKQLIDKKSLNDSGFSETDYPKDQTTIQFIKKSLEKHEDAINKQKAQWQNEMRNRQLCSTQTSLVFQCLLLTLSHNKRNIHYESVMGKGGHPIYSRSNIDQHQAARLKDTGGFETLREAQAIERSFDKFEKLLNACDNNPLSTYGRTIYQLLSRDKFSDCACFLASHAHEVHTMLAFDKFAQERIPADILRDDHKPLCTPNPFIRKIQDFLFRYGLTQITKYIEDYSEQEHLATNLLFRTDPELYPKLYDAAKRSAKKDLRFLQTTYQQEELTNQTIEEMCRFTYSYDDSTLSENNFHWLLRFSELITGYQLHRTTSDIYNNINPQSEVKKSFAALAMRNLTNYIIGSGMICSGPFELMSTCPLLLFSGRTRKQVLSSIERQNTLCKEEVSPLLPSSQKDENETFLKLFFPDSTSLSNYKHMGLTRLLQAIHALSNTAFTAAKHEHIAQTKPDTPPSGSVLDLWKRIMSPIRQGMTQAPAMCSIPGLTDVFSPRITCIPAQVLSLTETLSLLPECIHRLQEEGYPVEFNSPPEVGCKTRDQSQDEKTQTTFFSFGKKQKDVATKEIDSIRESLEERLLQYRG